MRRRACLGTAVLVLLGLAVLTWLACPLRTANTHTFRAMRLGMTEEQLRQCAGREPDYDSRTNPFVGLPPLGFFERSEELEGSGPRFGTGARRCQPHEQVWVGLGMRHAIWVRLDGATGQVEGAWHLRLVYRGSEPWWHKVLRWLGH